MFGPGAGLWTSVIDLSGFFPPGVGVVDQLLRDGAGKHGVGAGSTWRPEGGRPLVERSKVAPL